MPKPYLLYKSNGKIWVAGHHVWGLCSAWNFATKPDRPMTDADHNRSFTYARAIKNRMTRLGYGYKTHYIELSDGTLCPVKEHRAT